MTPDILEFLRYGALAISAFCLFLSFFLVWNGNRSNLQVFGFMVFSVIIFFGSLLADPASGLMGLAAGQGEEAKPATEETNTTATTVAASQLKTWDSGWFPVVEAKDYRIEHQMTSAPLTASIWYRRSGSEDMHLMDGVFENGGGYGAWIMDVTRSSLVVSTGPKSATSGYGGYNHWTALDRGKSSNSEPRELRVVITYK